MELVIILIAITGLIAGFIIGGTYTLVELEKIGYKFKFENGHWYRVIE